MRGQPRRRDGVREERQVHVSTGGLGGGLDLGQVVEEAAIAGEADHRPLRLDRLLVAAEQGRGVTRSMLSAAMGWCTR